MTTRIQPDDEYNHEPTADAGFNESMYVNTYDPAARLGAFFRVGNRVNEGMAEVTTCVYLPDGRVAFSYRRPRISSNETLDAGGLRFDVIEPFEEIDVRFDGTVTILEDPLEMRDPKQAFLSNPSTTCSAFLRFRAMAPVFGGKGDDAGDQGQSNDFAKAHYEQLVTSEGTIAVGGDTFDITGFGLRDHSWGPRSWQAPWYYRWLTGAGPDGFGFMASRVASREGDGVRGGFVWDDGELHLCRHAEITTKWNGDEHYHQTIEARLSTADREWNIAGEVLSLIPLRNRRDGKVTRISEGLTRWDCGGRTAFGLWEYLDQIVDGEPVGIDE